MRILTVVLVALALQSAPPPDSEIYLAPIAIRDGAIRIGPPADISNNPGYDNQPSFTPDGAALLFTSVRGGRTPDPANPAASGSDIYRYDLATRQVTQLTRTVESEYSPTVMPDRIHFSTVRVEAGGTQRLWRFAMDGSAPALLLPGLEPVGYHVWIDDTTAALYVLGQPATLQLADMKTGRAEVVATGIGRSLQRAPDGTISFVRREESGAAVRLTIHGLAPASRQTTLLVAAPDGATEADTAWTPDGTLLMAHGSTLYGWRRGEPSFKAVADLAALGLRGVTRLAVSPKGDQLALVGAASPPAAAALHWFASGGQR